MNKKENEKQLEKINKARGDIDDLDLQILYLLNKRATKAIELGKMKSKLGKGLYDPYREKDIFVSLTRKNPGPLPPDAIVRLFEQIITESKGIEGNEAYPSNSDE